VHKQLALTLAIGYTLFITILSLISLNNIPKLGSSFDDKIYHFGAYAVFVMVWYNFFEKTSSKYKILFSAAISLTYGIIVEIFQGTFTTYRTEDVVDVLANSLGVIFAVMLIFIYRKIKLK
jgi:glycopeptide antibiotics resistance protein